MLSKLFLALAILFATGAMAQTNTTSVATKTNSKTVSATGIEGTWMYGNFSLTEYWSTSPRSYLGNAFTFAIAFRFNTNGTYEQYFTSSVNNYGISTYHQSLTKGTYKVDEVAKTLTATPSSSHYKRTSMGRTQEDRDMRADEIKKVDVYTFTTGIEPNGTKALSLTIKGTTSALKFLKKDF